MVVRYVLPFKAENCGENERRHETVKWSEVLSLASCYMCLRGSELSLLLQIGETHFSHCIFGVKCCVVV